MTGWALALTIALAAFKLLVTCLPTDAVKWILRKFELHAQLNDTNTEIMYDGKRIEGEAKQQIIQAYNEAAFLKTNHIFPGNEALFLTPEDGGTPFVIDTKQGKKDIRLLVFSYPDHVDVVKQYKKKLTSFTLESENLQIRAISGEAV